MGERRKQGEMCGRKKVGDLEVRMDERLEGKKKWIRGLYVSEENTGEG
jgi:hypothetical protein